MMGLGIRKIKSEMTGTGGGRWMPRATAKQTARKARRAAARVASLLSGVWLLCAACNTAPPSPGPRPPAPAPAPTSADAGPPAPPADVYTRACAAVRAAGCHEGVAVNCADRMRLADERRLTRVNAACLAGAHTAADVHACGPFVKCEAQ